MMKMHFSRLVLIAATALVAGAAHAFNVSANTVLGLSVTHATPTATIVEYDFNGNVQETLTVTGMQDTGIGLAVIGNDVFVGDVSGFVYQVNLTTGAVFNSFQSTANEGLGDDGTNLLALNYTTGNVERFTTAGGSLGSVPVATGGTGIDGDATGFWVGMYGGSGDALRYDNSGNLLTTVTTGLSSSAVSALGWDAGNGALWLATGFGDDQIRAFDVNGNLLANFASGEDWINGLDVVANPIPEPTTMALLGIGGLLVARKRRK